MSLGGGPRAGAAGYSSTPLVDKLGIREGQRLLVIDPPRAYRELVPGVPTGVAVLSRCRKPVDMIHLFVTTRAGLENRLRSCRERLAPKGTIWISWPKKTSAVAADIDENAIRVCALAVGLVDVKVCAVDAVWSGLKLVVRRRA